MPMNSSADTPDETPRVHNLYTHSEAYTQGEVIESLLEGDQFRLERIVSGGQSTPPGEWYDQDESEWVVLLSGEAQVRFEASGDTLTLKPGDYIHLPARCRHRVESTAPDAATTWLALHYR